MRRGWRGLLAAACGWAVGGVIWGQETAPSVHPLPTGILGTLYASPAQTGREATVTSIERLAGHRNRLWVAVMDAAGHEILDVWDTRKTSQPALEASIDFGSVLTNGVMFTPVALAPFADGLLLQVRTGLRLYRFQAGGQLALERELPTLGTGLGLGLTQLHVSGRHASMLQQVIPNERITAENLGRAHREVLFDLADPTRPLFLWAGADGPSVTLADPINGCLDGNPASLAFDASQNWIRLTAVEAARDAHRDAYWQPKLRRVFSAGTLERPLRALLEQALAGTDLAAIQARGMRVFAASTGPAEIVLTARLLEHHAANELLKDVLAGYGIALDDPLELALAKAMAGGMDTSLEERLAQEWYSPLLQSWSGVLLAPGVSLRTAEDTRSALAAAFDVDLDEQTLARYLTRSVVSPLLGNPDFMEWTLGELLDRLANSTAGQLIDAMLQTAGGFGAVNAVLDSVRDLIDSIPGVDIPSLPACARFPDSTERLLDLALFSWNEPERGVALNRDGLAWFELFKFHRYLTGHTDFAEYRADMDRRLRELQRELSGNLAARLSEAFDLPGATGDLAALHDRVASLRQARFLAGRLLGRSLLETLPAGQAPTLAASVREALSGWGLRVQELGYPESTVADLVAAMEARGLGQTLVGEIFERAAVHPAKAFRAQLEQALRLQAQASFGLSDLDLPLMEALRPCLDFDVGVQRILGNWLSGLWSGLLGDGPGMSSHLLQYRHAFENHDCIARWLVVLDAVGAASSWFGGEAPARALEFALEEAYRAGVAYVVQAMFGGLIQDLGGREEPVWLASQIVSRTRQWTSLEPLAGATTTTMGAFAWQRRVAAVVQQRFENDWFGPRSVQLVLFQAGDPEDTRRVYDLGRWQSVNYANHHEGALYVGGSYFAPGDGAFPSGKALVVDLNAAAPRVQRLAGSAYTELASAPRLAGANYDACLAVGGVNRVYLIPNPAGASPLAEEPSVPPSFLQPLASATVAREGSHTFAVRIAGTAPWSCRWFKDGVQLPAAEGTRLQVVATNTDAGGVYTVVVSNLAGSATHSATLTVLAPEAFRIVRQPSDAARFLGQSATLSVGVEASGAPAFQWFHRRQALAGKTQADLSLSNLDWADAGEYFVEIRQSGATLRSDTVRVELIEPAAPLVLRSPATRQPLGLGASATLTSTAVGWGNLTWQWFRDGEPLPMGAGADLPLGEVTAATAGSTGSKSATRPAKSALERSP